MYMTKNIWLCRNFGKVWEVKQMTKSEFAEILTRATEGDHTALGRIFELYMPLIDKHSVVGGRFDEDCKQYIMFQIVLQITRFKI
jgi:ATP phosphoribosyltransferase regulatory subunit HisZ